MKRKLFKKVPDAERRTIPLKIMLNAAEDEAIKRAAEIRILDKSEYVRRAALGRRADVRYETEIVLALTKVTQSIRALHVDLMEKGIAPSAEAMRVIVKDARDAIRRIEK
ncbi:hypothetical protein RHDC4_00059 [Rhodocyclaceae bacterium]|nr:hypothetical protein RHDC4_00059 [Rhodocyclaceae bacterium]